MIRSFRRQPKATGGNEGSGVCDDEGPWVKRLRRGPLTPQTWVRFPHGSPFFSATAYKTLYKSIRMCYITSAGKRRERGQSPLSCFLPFGK